MPLTPELCRAARAWLNWSQQELADRAQVARKTIADFEGCNVEPQHRTLRDVRAVLEDAGIEFLPAEENVSRGGMRLRWEHAQKKQGKWRPVKAAAPPLSANRLR